jgi:hypothetical protein
MMIALNDFNNSSYAHRHKSPHFGVRWLAAALRSKMYSMLCPNLKAAASRRTPK